MVVMRQRAIKQAQLNMETFLGIQPHIVRGCFHAKTLEMSSCNRVYRAQKSEKFTVYSFTEKVYLCFVKQVVGTLQRNSFNKIL